jgi:hypothetical protein
MWHVDPLLGNDARGVASWGKGQEMIYPVLKVPRQCPLVLLAEVMNVIGIHFLWCCKGCIVVKFDLTLGGLH